MGCDDPGNIFTGTRIPRELVDNADFKAQSHSVDRSYNPSEQDKVIEVFSNMLRAATKDGGKKRALGLKDPWWKDSNHEAAIFSHLSKWKHGEKQDKDSGAHPLIHLGWRCLAQAYIEIYGPINPEGRI